MKTKKPRFFYGYIVVAAAFFIIMVVMGTMYSFGVFFKPLSAEFGWTRAVTSGAFSLSFFLHGLLGIVTGRLNDRFGPRIIITVCGFILGLGYLLMSQVSTVWQLYLFWGVLVGIGVSGYVPLISTVSRWFVKRRGLMTGIVLSGIGVGIIIIPPIAGQLISKYGWSISYIIMGIIALILIILAAQFLRRDPSQVGQLPDGESEVRQESLSLEARGFSLQEAIHTGQFWMLCAIFFCGVLCVQGIMVHIVPHATDLEISPASAASVLVIIGGLNIGGRIIIGGASDRIGDKLALTIAFIIMSLALFWLVAAKEIWALYLFAVVFGFGYGGMAVLESPIVAELFGLRAHGVTLGIVIFAATIGGAIGPVLVGGIFDIMDSYQPAFLICAVLCITAIILTQLLRPAANKGGEK